MKHWNRRLGIKILCFVLVIPLLAAAVAGGYGLYVLWKEGFYTEEKPDFRRQMFSERIRQDGYQMMRHYTDVMTYGDVTEITNLLTWPSNLRYRLTDASGKEIAANIPPDETHVWTAELVYGVEQEIGVRYDYGQQELIPFYSPYLRHESNVEALQEGEYLLQAWVDDTLSVNDEYRKIQQTVNLGYALRYWGIAIVGACLLLAILGVVNLLATASRRPNSDALHPGKFHKVPSDGMAALWALAFALSAEALYRLRYFSGGYGSRYLYRQILAIVWSVALAYTGLGLLVGAVGRAKQGCLVKNTLVYRLLCRLRKAGKKLAGFAKECYVNLPLIWKTLLFTLAFGLWALLLWVTAVGGSAFSGVLLLFTLPMMVGSVVVAMRLRSLEKAGEALAAGELSYQVDTDKLTGAFRKHGENLNSISAGMYRAVEERMKSERMKTELVTNVSHDIKNPLTSIINYAGLIAAEPCENENHKEYAQVLRKKSEHLKRLLEDLVEISRATTGNLEVELRPCDAGTLLGQLAGEFSDRCTAAGLTLMTCRPEMPLTVNLDSRRIWRVFENLMQNACKYSLPGSRVYVSLERMGAAAAFTIRNTSREPLNMRPEELMERFVRGDSARTGEGNGLGLSIARSLTELQGGEMRVTIDGDLFKVTLYFPAVE